MIQSVSEIISEIENGLDCESPIESKLCWQLRQLGIEYETQKEVGNRRLDIVIGKINIECDGKEFHCEETDLRRDIEVSKNGYKIVRVMGREIFRNPKRVAWVIGLIADKSLPKINDYFFIDDISEIRARNNYPYDMMIKIYNRNNYFWIPCALKREELF